MKRSTRHRLWKWFWWCNLPIYIALYSTVDDMVLLLYVGIISVYANAEASAAAEFSAEVSER